MLRAQQWKDALQDHLSKPGGPFVLVPHGLFVTFWDAVIMSVFSTALSLPPVSTQLRGISGLRPGARCSQGGGG